MIILKICKDHKHIGREAKSYGKFIRISRKEIIVGEDHIYFATPCFVDAEQYHSMKFDSIENLVDLESCTDREAKWIMELYGFPELQVRNPDPLD